jgi:hypothetical protein
VSPAAVVLLCCFGIGQALLHFVSYFTTNAMSGSAFILLSSDGPKMVLDGLLEHLVLDNYNVIVIAGVLMA